MASYNPSDTLRKEPPTVKVQIGVNGYKMVLCFSNVELAQQYFASVHQSAALNPQISGNALEVSLDLRKARKIVLGKNLRGPFNIQFRTCWSAKKWHQLSNLSYLYPRKGRCVVIAEPETHPVEGLRTHVDQPWGKFSGIAPSPQAALNLVIQRAESVLLKGMSTLSSEPHKHRRVTYR